MSIVEQEARSRVDTAADFVSYFVNARSAGVQVSQSSQDYLA